MLLAYLAIVPGMLQSPGPQRATTLTGNITRIPAFESKIVENKRDIWIYLPPGYEEKPKDRFPVLYCHDGQNVFDGATSFINGKEWRVDEAANALISAGLIEPLIIVAVSNAGTQRGNEYLPTRFKTGNTNIGGKADLYGRFLVEEVKPYMDEKYRTKPDGKNTGLMGSSLGGVATLYLGLKHPNVFSRLAVLSPSVWVNDREPLRWIESVKRKPNLRVWVDMGGKESPGAIDDAKLLVQALEAKGWRSGKDVVLYEDGFAEHNEEAWARRVPAILMWLFGKGR